MSKRKPNPNLVRVAIDAATNVELQLAAKYAGP